MNNFEDFEYEYMKDRKPFVFDDDSVSSSDDDDD